MFTRLARHWASGTRRSRTHRSAGIKAARFGAVEPLEKRLDRAVYIDIETYHVDITIPRYDANDVLIGYDNYSYSAKERDWRGILGGPGQVVVTPHDPDWDPTEHHEVVIETTPEQERQMAETARQIKENPPPYNVAGGNTCVTVTMEILEDGGFSPPPTPFGGGVSPPWTGYGFEEWVERVKELKARETRPWQLPDGTWFDPETGRNSWGPGPKW